jgi:hypothetical protein
MDAVNIEARVMDDANPPFWSRAELRGCLFDSFTGGGRDRIITGLAKIAPQTLLTFRIAGGDLNDMFEEFWIVCVDPNQPEQMLGDATVGYLNGRFEIVAHGNGELMASRLRVWWFQWAPDNGGQTARVAKWLMRELEQVQDLPAPCPDPPGGVDHTRVFDPVEAWEFEPIKWE